MKLDAKTIQGLAFLGLDGATVLIPVLALPVQVLEGLVTAIEESGEAGAEVPAHMAAQLASIAAGMAAARASAVTSYRAQHPQTDAPPTFVSGFTVVAGPAVAAGALPAAEKTGGGSESVQVIFTPTTQGEDPK